MKKPLRVLAIMLALMLSISVTSCSPGDDGESSIPTASTNISDVTSGTDDPTTSDASETASTSNTSSEEKTSSTGKTSSNGGTASTTVKPPTSTGTELGSKDDTNELPTLVKPTVPNGTITLSCINVPSEVGVCEKLIAGFKKQYPGIDVKLEKITGEYDNKIITQSASGTVADVISVMDYMLSSYINHDVVKSLDALYTDYKFNEKYYISSLLDISKGADGKLYMAPREYSHIVVAVNKTILKSENIEMPKNDWTYSDFLDIVKKTTKKNASGKVTQFGVSGAHSDPNVWSSFVLGYGGTIAKNGKLTLSDANSIKGLTELFNLVTSDYMANDYDPNEASKFMNGQATFYFTSRPGIENVNTSLSKLRMEWDVLPMFSMPQGRYVGFGTVGYAVTNKSKNQDKSMATAFVNYVLSTDGQTKLLQTGATIPVIKGLQAQGAWKDLPVSGKNSEAFIYKPEDDNTNPPHIALSPNRYIEMKNQMQQAQLKIFAKETSVADAMKVVDKEVNAK